MQQGSLIRSPRKRGPDVWQFRWGGQGTVRNSGPCAGLCFLNELQRTRVRVVKPVKAELVKTALIHEQGCKKGAKTCPFAPSLVAAKLV